MSYPSIIKTSRLGYDGKGQFTINNYSDLLKCWNELDKTNCVIEEKINIKKEISIIGARTIDGRIKIFPSFKNIHKNHILDTTKLPSRTNKETEELAVKSTIKILSKLKYVGVLCVEFFIDDKGDLIANEMAPRVHNSGHITIEACKTSQFEQHLRAITGQELGEIDIIKPAIQALKKLGINIDGPVPADTAFISKYIKEYDVIHTMYHDQGLPVIKYDDFSKTTNVTLGLPIIRVSVDHGTATDLVGTGNVDISSFVQALKVAREISKSAT